MTGGRRSWPPRSADLGFDVDIGPAVPDTRRRPRARRSRTTLHAVGVSTLAAGHRTLVPQLIGALKAQGAPEVAVVRRRRDSAAGLRLSESCRSGRNLRAGHAGTGGRSQCAGSDPGSAWICRRLEAIRRTRCPARPRWADRPGPARGRAGGAAARARQGDHAGRIDPSRPSAARSGTAGRRCCPAPATKRSGSAYRAPRASASPRSWRRSACMWSRPVTGSRCAGRGSVLGAVRRLDPGRQDADGATGAQHAGLHPAFAQRRHAGRGGCPDARMPARLRSGRIRRDRGRDGRRRAVGDRGGRNDRRLRPVAVAQRGR